MATATSHEHQPNQYLPPSPPSSPPQTRKRHKKRTDSFEKLANTPIPSPPPSPSQDPLADENQEPVLTKIILTPILFTSFILSLSFVNLRDRVHRTYSYSSTSFLTYLYPSNWLDAEPYQDPDNSRWDLRGSTTHAEPHDAIGPNQGGPNGAGKKRKRSWHLNKKIRKMARLEISDAFDMSGSVIVGMLAVMGLASIVLWMGTRWMLASLWHLLLR